MTVPKPMARNREAKTPTSKKPMPFWNIFYSNRVEDGPVRLKAPTEQEAIDKSERLFPNGDIIRVEKVRTTPPMRDKLYHKPFRNNKDLIDLRNSLKKDN